MAGGLQTLGNDDLERRIADVVRRIESEREESPEREDPEFAWAPLRPLEITPVTVVSFASGTPAPVGFTVFDASPYVPPGTQALILDWHAICDDVGAVTAPPVLAEAATFKVRRESGAGEMILGSVAASTSLQAGGGIGMAWCTARRKFEWALTLGLSGAYQIRLIGYYGF